ncbi:glycoside hydrolase family 3 N-terminal domain-containing protein [Actinoallomurus soli]|uniref:glycoside hydrolase family 3 N-terminal domain-containing protein n=1 Tax=Actinoallomurus soli TaxID=2952535 RepID=UPI00387332C9
MPTWARNMTTYGEDPYLAAQLTGREINALQNTGLMSQVKHFCRRTADLPSVPPRTCPRASSRCRASSSSSTGSSCSPANPVRST